MLHYSKKAWGLYTLFSWYGSAFPRALPFALVASAIAVFVSVFWKEHFRVLWLHPYPFQIFGLVAGFMILFRCAVLIPLTGHCYTQPL
jgi:predicted membrane chloride channel (bestrophin family)